MALATGTPLGLIESQEDIYIEGAPFFYFQERENGHYEHNPDGDGFYWGMSGTTGAPVYQAGCYEDVSWAEDRTVNTVRCDAVGDKAAIMKRNFLDLTLTLTSLFPLTSLKHMIHGSEVTETPGETEKMGLGDIDNATYYRVYMPKVYDEAAADYVCITGHKCQFIGALELAMSGDNRWGLSVTVRFLADDDVPAAQKFATIIRLDPSAI